MNIKRHITQVVIEKQAPNSFKVSKVQSPVVIKSREVVSITNNYAGGYEEATLTGSINDINKVFTTPDSYVSNTTSVFINGLKQRRGIDYTETAANQITFDEAPSAIGYTDNLTINYIKE